METVHQSAISSWKKSVVTLLTIYECVEKEKH